MNKFTSIQYEFKTFPDNKFMHKNAHETIKYKFPPLTGNCRKASYFSMINTQFKPDQTTNKKHSTSACQRVTMLLTAN